jgi:ABC-type transport system substrate-binding protein
MQVRIRPKIVRMWSRSFASRGVEYGGKSSGLLSLVSASAQHEAGPYGIQPARKGGVVMKNLVVGSIVLMLVILGWGNRRLGEAGPASRGELRIVDKHPLNWVSITYNVFEHLMEVDKDGKLVPRLATGWRWLDARTLEVVLRQGVKFHNGEVFDAEIVQLNWEENTRLRQPFRPGTFLNFKPGSKLDILDPYTVRFVFPEPDGGALAKISFLHIGNRQFYREQGWGEKDW